MKGLAKKYKLFTIIALLLLVAGMAIFGIFGFNQTVDHKDSFEVRVSVEQKADKALEVLQNSTEDFFAQKDIKASSMQKMDDGKLLIYKFSKDVAIDEVALQTYLQDKLTAEGVKNITATAEYSEVIGYTEFEIGWLLLALGVGIVAVFLYALIMEKLAGAVAVASVSVASFLGFTALVALTRIPAYPVFGAGLCLATLVGTALAYSIVAKCKEEYRKLSASNPNAFEIAQKASKLECKKFVLIAIAFVLSAIAVSAFLVPNMLVAGGQIVLAGITSLTLAYFGAPLMWALIKGAKK